MALADTMTGSQETLAFAAAARLKLKRLQPQVEAITRLVVRLNV